MIIRFLIGILLGMLVGVVLYEGLLAASGLFSPDHALIIRLTQNSTMTAGSMLILSLFWALATCASVLVASGLSRSRFAGAICALVWMVPILLLLGLGQDTFLALAIAVLIGLLAWLVSLRLIESDQP